MTGQQLRAAREQKAWNQQQAAGRLGVSQPYLSLLEAGIRRVPQKLGIKAVRVYGLSAAQLPVSSNVGETSVTEEQKLARQLAALGYPGFSHLKSRARKRNPAELLLSALASSNLDSRIIEALPWIVFKFADLDWRWLTQAAKARELQNRLGYITSVARRLAELNGETEKARLLGSEILALERSRLMREETLCHDSLTEAEKRWLRKNRPADARRWRLLTDLAPEQLNHAA